MDSKEDEEITIDFGKIKKFFKSDKEEEKVEGISSKSTKIEVSDAEHSKHLSAEEKKEDEELSIDFSKIKSFFKSKEGTEHVAKEHKKDEDEIEFDFSRIKRFFKSGEKESSEVDEIQVNWSKITDFFKKYGVVFLALIPIILSIYIRMQPAFLPITDDWATNNVINGIRSQIRNAIDQQYPNLPNANKNALVDTELQKVIRENKGQIDEQIKAASRFFKSLFQDEDGKNYMPDIDPYYWVRYAQNIVENGHPGDILKYGRPFDNHQLAPIGRFVHADMFHPYSLAYFYKLLHIFSPELSLMRSSFYLPVLVSALCVLLVFLIARKIVGNLGGFFAGLIMAANAAFLGRTLFGHADNDIWVILFPLLVTWLFVTTIDVESITKVVILSALAGFFTGLYTTAWSGWWYIFDFLLATIAIELIYLVAIRFKDIRSNFKYAFNDHAIRSVVIVGVVYFLSTAIFTVLFSGWLEFISSFIGPLSFPSIKAPVTPYIWPNVLTTVAELNEGSINGIINSMGGPFLFFISLLGLVLAISRSNGLKKFDFIYIVITAVFYGSLFVRLGANSSALYESLPIFGLLVLIVLPIFIRIGISIHQKDLSYDFKLPILLCLWVASTIFASIKGIRFTLLLAPAFSVAFGVALGKIYSYLSRLLTKELKIHKVVGNTVLVIVLLLVYVNPIKGAINSAGSDIPLVNDAWYNTLISIKQNSKENAIITSWWDFGHHFKLIADRPVTFDGTTQTDAASHWVGRLFMTDNELEALGIIRMLDCGHNNATAELSKINNNLITSIKIVKEIILLDKEKARKKLLKLGLNKQQTEEILSYTHCNPPEAFVIASEDMIGKSGVWSHFGSWNFERADIWFNARKMPQQEAVEYMMNKFNYTKDRAENIYFEMQAISSDSEANAWVAPWPGYGGTVSCSKNDEDIYVCGNGLQINMSNKDVFGIGQQGIVRPKAVAFTNDEGIFKREFTGTTLDFGVTAIPRNENEIELVISSKELTGGMFTRMFYMEGHGLRYFKLFNHQRGLTGTDIYTYKVDWEGKNTTIVEAFVKKPSKEERTEEAEKGLAENADSTPSNSNNLTENDSS